MQPQKPRTRATGETRAHILDVALDLLGRDADASMEDIASAAGVVRRTVYGHFPSRAALVRTLARQAIIELTAAITDVSDENAADLAWVDFVRRLWPLARKYRVLVTLRRGEYGAEIHGLLGPVDAMLADLVDRGQRSAVFARHLPRDVLSQVAYGAVFTVADSDPADTRFDAAAAAVTSLLILGVPEARAVALANDLH